jgi:hypothetical protein
MKKGYKMAPRIKDPFTHARNLAFHRSACQARFRGEVWSLTFEEFCHFWHSESLWEQRGRKIEALVLTRWDTEKPWDTKNCCIITRDNQLKAKIERYWGNDDAEYFKDAIWYE